MRCGRPPPKKRYQKNRDGTPCEKVYCSLACYDADRAEAVAARLRPCPICGKPFDPHRGRNLPDRVFCSMPCRKAGLKAKPRPCSHCGALFTPVKRVPKTGRWISHNSGRTCSATCQEAIYRTSESRKAKIGAAFRGAKHPAWKGGIATINDTSRRGPDWPRQRQEAIRRHGGRCTDCGIDNAECRRRYRRGLDVDHREPFHNFSTFAEANRPANLVPRCASCHKKAESGRAAQMLLPLSDHGRGQHKGHQRGETINTAKLTAAQVVAIREAAAAGESLTILALRFGVTVSSASSIVTGKTWKHVGGPRSKPLMGRNASGRPLTDTAVVEMRERHAAGVSCTELAALFNVSVSTASNVVRGKVYRNADGPVARREGRARGAAHGMAKWTVEQIVAVKQALAAWGGRRYGRNAAIAQACGVSLATVAAIARGKIWRCVDDEAAPGGCG